MAVTDKFTGTFKKFSALPILQLISMSLSNITNDWFDYLWLMIDKRSVNLACLYHFTFNKMRLQYKCEIQSIVLQSTLVFQSTLDNNQL